MSSRKYLWLAILLMLSLLAVACGGQDEATPTPEPSAEEPEEAAEPAEEVEEEAEAPEEEAAALELDTIKVGYIPILGFAPYFVAQERGYFEDQGLNVEMELFRSGDPMIAPLSQGQLDVGGGETGPALFNAVNRDLDVRVVGALAAQPEGYGAVPLLVRTELSESGEVTTPGDLAGRKVAVNIERGTAEYLLAKALEKDGLSLGDVELVSIPFPEIPAALANAAVDAAILPHPLAGRALGEGDAVVLLNGDQIVDNPQNGVIYFGQKLLDPANRETAVRFLVAYLMAARELQGDAFRSEDDIVNAIVEWTSVPEPAVRNGVAYYFDPAGAINTASTEDFQAYHVGNGYTEYSEPMPLDAIIVSDFLDEALARLDQ
ncbi:MAG: ABC transporter substrate-binding protein [Chloroflexota bacterium]|nr:MAG: ABC transporter substrate-binding protein [Chloroflexota bacterium]